MKETIIEILEREISETQDRLDELLGGLKEKPSHTLQWRADDICKCDYWIRLLNAFRRSIIANGYVAALASCIQETTYDIETWRPARSSNPMTGLASEWKYETDHQFLDFIKNL